MGRWILKGCPRCSGDLTVSEAEYGINESCLQCGYYNYSENAASGESPDSPVEKEPVSVEN